ncbi:MAG: trypsin-like peptidase domain-containing protein [Chloroflexota bacterium]|nr:trypsin-like peptidase domain-containing protein [Chloroflexota bacterium]
MSEVLKSLSDDLAAAVATAGHSIVRIEGRRRSPASGIVWSADGMIVTAHHVVERDDNLKVGLPDGSTVSATLVGRDPSTDIALLRVQASGLTPATWINGADAKVGHLVMAVGRPGTQAQATLGIISAIDEGWRTPMGGMIDAYVQTDVVMYPGFSGGPLVGANGAFVGMNSSALMRGVSVTIPAATLTRVAGTLMAHGRVKRGYLGVSAQPVRLPAALAGSLNQETGLLLASVEAGSPAEQAGLMLGDTLISLAGHPVHQMDDLMAVLSGDRVGTSVPARIVRGGQVHEIAVTIGERS